MKTTQKPLAASARHLISRAAPVLALLTSLGMASACELPDAQAQGPATSGPSASSAPGGSGTGPVSTPAETFTAADAPTAFSVSATNLANSQAHSFNFLSPWGYARSANATRLYPLVVVGCWNESGGFSEQVRKKYPSFYLDFNNFYTDTDGQTLAGLIDAAQAAGYRIDLNRVYLTGFSQGGSGSFKLVRGMLAKGKLFAGIIRVAGQSESTLAEGAMAKTALWYHIGLNDDAARVTVARTTYTNLKNHSALAGASESSVNDTLTGFDRVTKTLTRNGIAMVKMSEYTGMGHDPSACYRDPALFDWLFNQTLGWR